ncbi:Pentatricopeptide repeat-containing protein [Nymphaea thermarum]|nr:Pentatricopeptide repeat-containing protein [Nymphaea thermarum]
MLGNCIKQSNFTFAMMVGDCLISFHASFHSIGDSKHIFGEMPERDLPIWSHGTLLSHVGEVELAHQLLNEIPMLRNVISRIAQVGGYGQAGRLAEMAHLFVQMLISADNINPNSAIMVSLVSATSDVCSYELSTWICASIHVNKSVVPEAIRLFDQMYEEEMRPNEITMEWSQLGTALIDMYSKCGCITNACHVFVKMPNNDVAAWNSKISGFATQAKARRLLEFCVLATLVARACV